MAGHSSTWPIAAVALMALVVASVRAQQTRPDATGASLEMLKVQGNLYLLAGDGGNISIQIGNDGVLLVDTGVAALAPKAIEEIRKLSGGPIRFVVNTHVHADHVGGNEAVARLPMDPLQPLAVMAHGNVLNRLTKPVTGKETPPAQLGLPIDEYFSPTKDLHFNGEAIVLYHEPNAHTDGDSVVLFRGSDVVSAGDIFTPGAYPFIDRERGGSVAGEIAALNHILQLTVPAKTQEGGTYVIPGHGRIGDEADVVEYRDMVVIVRDRIRDLRNKRMTLEQVKAARPTRDYDAAYVSPGSLISADQFVEAVYKSLAP